MINRSKTSKDLLWGIPSSETSFTRLMFSWYKLKSREFGRECCKSAWGWAGHVKVMRGKFDEWPQITNETVTTVVSPFSMVFNQFSTTIKKRGEGILLTSLLHTFGRSWPAWMNTYRHFWPMFRALSGMHLKFMACDGMSYWVRPDYRIKSSVYEN